MRGLRDPDRRRQGRRPLPSLSGYEARHLRSLLAEALCIRGQVSAAAVRQREHVRRPAELLHDLERGGFLAFEPERV
jgi:hypothetical protein